MASLIQIAQAVAQDAWAKRKQGKQNPGMFAPPGPGSNSGFNPGVIPTPTMPGATVVPRPNRTQQTRIDHGAQQQYLDGQTVRPRRRIF